MPHDDYKTLAGTRLPPIEATLINAIGAPAENLVGATVTLKYRPIAGGAWVEKVCTIVDPAAATVRYNWEEGDTDTPGVYVGYFHVVYADGRDEPFPSGRHLRIRFRGA